MAVDVWLGGDPGQVKIRATVRCQGATGVEMEALTAVGVAALTVIDMVKSLDPWAQVGSIALRSKRGGRSGGMLRPGLEADSAGAG